MIGPQRRPRRPAEKKHLGGDLKRQSRRATVRGRFSIVVTEPDGVDISRVNRVIRRREGGTQKKIIVLEGEMDL